MTKIYLVSKGCYSYYHIVGVYSTAELANEVVTEINKHDTYDKAEIEEYDLDQPTVKPGYAWYTVFIDRDGNVCGPRWANALEGQDEQWFTVCRDSNRTSTQLHISRFVDSMETIVKIANEHRAMWLAVKPWPDLPAFKTMPYSFEENSSDS